MTTTMNILGLSESARQKLVSRAKGELAVGDDRLAKQIIVAAAQQLAAHSRHYADEIQTVLEAARKSAAGSGAHDQAPDHEH